MDKQKRIEEIEQFLARKILGGKSWNTRDIAEGVYELITENAVVLTQEEWATVHEQFAQAMYQKEVNTRKETAENFADMIIEKHGYDPLTHEGDEDIEISLTASELYEICNKLKQNTKGENQ